MNGVYSSSQTCYNELMTTTRTTTHIVIRNLEGQTLGRYSVSDTTLYPVPPELAYTYDSVEQAGEQINKLGMATEAYVDELVI